MSAFTLPISLVDDVKLLDREVENEDKTLASLSAIKASMSISQGDLRNLHLENVSLAKKLDELTNVVLAYISNSFENTLLQVEHFFSPLRILREQVQPN